MFFKPPTCRCGCVGAVWRCCLVPEWLTSHGWRNPTTVTSPSTRGVTLYAWLRSGWMSTSPTSTWPGTSLWRWGMMSTLTSVPLFFSFFILKLHMNNVSHMADNKNVQTLMNWELVEIITVGAINRRFVLKYSAAPFKLFVRGGENKCLRKAKTSHNDSPCSCRTTVLITETSLRGSRWGGVCSVKALSGTSTMFTRRWGGTTTRSSTARWVSSQTTH